MVVFIILYHFSRTDGLSSHYRGIFIRNPIPLRGTTKHEKELDPHSSCQVTLPPKRVYTRDRTESGHTGRKYSSAPSLNKKLTGDTWSHSQVSRSPEQHAEEFLCWWYPTWPGSLTHVLILREDYMQVIYTRCCGIDLHKKVIVACLLICTAQGVHKEIQTFSTMLQDLYRLCDWLKAKQCQVVAMESTGVFWKSIWNV